MDVYLLSPSMTDRNPEVETQYSIFAQLIWGNEKTKQTKHDKWHLFLLAKLEEE